MKLFADTRIKRNTAFVMLLVWLFALASGVANACFLETHEPHSMAARGSATTTSRAPAEQLAELAAELLAHLGAPGGHGDDSDRSKESCLKVCDDGTHTLPNACASIDHTDPGPAPLVATLWAGSRHVVAAPHRPDDLAIPVVGPPFRVRYSRLAL